MPSRDSFRWRAKITGLLSIVRPHARPRDVPAHAPGAGDGAADRFAIGPAVPLDRGVLVIVPCIALFVFAILQNGGLSVLITISVTEQQWVERFWEPRFLWTVGATLWPVLPIGFAISIILATGISHWFFMKHLEPVRRNRAMAFSLYLCAPLGWVWIPIAACAVVMALPPLPETSQAVGDLGMLCVLACELSVLVIVLAIVNSVRTVAAATQCGLFRSLVAGAGVIVQAAVSFAIGFALFPAIVGLFRLMITSLWR